MNNYKNLKVWQESFQLVLDIYRLTDKLPPKEVYNLCSQLNRSAIAIVSNIAEGADRDSKKEFNNFLSMSMGSSYELETQLLVCNKLCYINDEELKIVLDKIDHIQRMIFNLKSTLKQNND